MKAFLRVVRDLLSRPSIASHGLPTLLPLWLSIPAVQDLTAGAWWSQDARRHFSSWPKTGRTVESDSLS